jgi:predicted transcriptional regulator
MAESKESQENLAYVRTHVDQLERMVKFQISANPQSGESILLRFKQREGMAEVYLALDGDPKTQDEIKVIVGRHQSTVSRVCTELLNAGLVMTVPSLKDRRKTAYAWSGLEGLVRVSRIARDYLASTKNGANSSKPSRKKPNGAVKGQPVGGAE